LISKINGLTISKDEESLEIIIHVSEDYDERYNCFSAEHRKNMINLILCLLKIKDRNCTVYKVSEAKLRKYTTLKSDKEKKSFKRPPQSSIDD